MSTYHYLFTYGGPQLFMLFVIFVVTPIIYRIFLRSRHWRVRLTSIFAIWIAATIAAYGDVFLIAREAQRLCREEAGMKIYRTAEAEGMVGLVDIKYWNEYGFKYIESGFPDARQYFRVRLVDGRYTKERVPAFLSEYEFRQGRKKMRLPIVELRDQVFGRMNGEVLGEIISYSFYPGWLDSRLLGLLGMSWSPPRCDGNYRPSPGKRIHDVSEFIKLVVKPKH